MNQIKKAQKTLQIERPIKALGHDEAMKILNTVNALAPSRQRIIDDSPLSSEELKALQRAIKKDTWIEVGETLKNKKSSAWLFGKLAFRYIKNEQWKN